VTAEKRSAIPLAHVAANLLQELEGFSEILWAKLVQRTGGWPIPIVPPREPDVDYTKLSGFREDESLSEFTIRVAGIMRVYFYILIAPVNLPLDPPFRVTRYWIYFARMLSDRQLLESGPVAPELLASKCGIFVYLYGLISFVSSCTGCRR
jgi:nucleoporin GLE1